MPEEQAEQDALDAARWRAFVGSARIKIFGSAGFKNPDTYGNDPKNYRHFGGEFWTIHTHPQTPEDKEYVTEILTGYADAAIAANKELEKSQSTEQ